MKGLAGRLSGALALVVGAMLVTAASVSAVTPIKISEDPYTNTTSNHKTQVEPDAFAWGNTIVSAFQSGRFFDGGASNIGLATSSDRGKTWTPGFLPASTVFATPAGKYPRASDPSVAFDAKHNAWLISWLGIITVNGPVDVLVSRSTDGGKTWSAPFVVNASGDFFDKNWTRCDNSPRSRFYGNCYTEYDDASKLNQFTMSTSSDGGQTWAAATNPSHTCVIGGQPVVQPNGTVVVPIDDCFETAIFSIISTDGGKTWSDPILVAQVLNDGHPGSIRSPDLPSADIDSSGRVFVVWTDCRFENFCNAPIGTNDLLITSSDDGVRWSLPARIPASPIGSGVDELLPGLGVSRGSGDQSGQFTGESGDAARLGLVYYHYPSSNCTVSTCQLEVQFISSANGGRSWSSPETVAGPMKLTWLPLTTQGFMVGDYFRTAIPPGGHVAYPIFMVAKAPTSGTTCTDLTTSPPTPGQHCDQATYTTPEGLLSIVGGPNATTSQVPAGAAPAAAPTSGSGQGSKQIARATAQ